MINLRLEPNEMDYIANLLARQPWMEVNALLVNLKQQVEANNANRNATPGDGSSESPKLASIGGGG